MFFHSYICTKEIANAEDVKAHLCIEHSVLENQSLKLQCCASQCNAKFSTFSSLKEHHEYHLPNHGADSTDVNSTNIITNDNSDNVQRYDSEKNEKRERPVFENFVLLLESSGISKTTVQTIVHAHITMVNKIAEDALKIAEKDLPAGRMKLREYFDEAKQSFSGLSTIHRRKQFFINSENFAVAKPLCAGHRFDQIYDRDNLLYETVAMTSTFMYVPIADILKFILSNPEIRREVIESWRHENRSLYIKNNPLFQCKKFKLQLGFYIDEFETVNPLGSKTGGHKLGGIYMVVRNLPGHFNSKLQHIHFVALYHDADVKDNQSWQKSSINQFLKPIV